VSNWSEYNDALRKRGNIDVWISDDIAETWYERNCFNSGVGAPKKFTDLAIITCHEIRQVFKLALRQCQGFINSIFKTKKVRARSPDYSCLSKRLATLEIKSPRYKKTKDNNKEVVATAIDSTGLKRFGRGEWQRVKNYSRRNYSELAMLRYKKIIGNRLHARDIFRQKNEAMLGCGILNKMTQLGIPKSYRFA